MGCGKSTAVNAASPRAAPALPPLSPLTAKQQWHGATDGARTVIGAAELIRLQVAATATQNQSSRSSAHPVLGAPSICDENLGPPQALGDIVAHGTLSSCVAHSPKANLSEKGTCVQEPATAACVACATVTTTALCDLPGVPIGGAAETCTEVARPTVSLPQPIAATTQACLGVDSVAAGSGVAVSPRCDGVSTAASSERVGTPPQLEDWKKVLCGRYEVKRSAFMGRGGFAVVRRGRDLEQRRMVAVKFYSEPGGESSDNVETFKHEVAILRQLKAANPFESVMVGGDERPPANGSFVLPMGVSVASDIGISVREMPSVGSELFVDLLDYSRDALTGEAGRDAQGFCFLVEEMGLQTLEQYIEDEAQFEGALERQQVLEVFASMAQIIAALHACGLTHLDIKPSNLMRFRRGDGRKGFVWKLLDMDGVHRAGAVVDPATITATPLYCSPELAAALTEGGAALRVSRKMDVWACGMTVLDCVLGKPLLQRRFQDDPGTFLAWLSGNASGSGDGRPLWGSLPFSSVGSDVADDAREPAFTAGINAALEADAGALPLPPKVYALDRELAEFLSTRVLRRSDEERCSILEVVQHLDFLQSVSLVSPR
eukprot:TRINITY_DN13793_c0_g1_i1.p1 TRINITY_DN13793_c0_g1~~TRINITY_DN13793_c0_g1_i1.p1  ORF type:complete len:604 (-),score=112.19 TRINITY_DN13793_c0_g1_i1:115-1926(-)